MILPVEINIYCKTKIHHFHIRLFRYISLLYKHISNHFFAFKIISLLWNRLNILFKSTCNNFSFLVDSICAYNASVIRKHVTFTTLYNIWKTINLHFITYRSIDRFCHYSNIRLYLLTYISVNFNFNFSFRSIYLNHLFAGTLNPNGSPTLLIAFCEPMRQRIFEVYGHFLLCRHFFSFRQFARYCSTFYF